MKRHAIPNCVVWGEIVTAMMLLTTLVGCAPREDTARTVPAERHAATPAPNLREPERVADLAELSRRADPDLVFIGDSITYNWEAAGRRVWDTYYEPRRALNLGVGWEQTENVLWRIEQGHLDGLRPGLIVLLIGTNNTQHGGDSPQAIADGIDAIVGQLRTRLPASRILLLGIFPRGRESDDALRRNNQAVNRLISALADGDSVHYRDIGGVFLGEDGSISSDVMPDYLHLTARGYTLWAEAIETDVERLLGAR